MKIIIIPLLLLFLQSSGQSDYCRAIEKRRPVDFYWDWHSEKEKKARPGISKELVYHQEIGSKDSVLEREIFYNKNGLPVLDKEYAVPTKEGVISEIRFTYSQHGLLTKMERRYISCIIGWINVSTAKQYDAAGREIVSVEDGDVSGDHTETIYMDRTIIKRELFPNGNIDTTAIYFLNNSGREDSMQVFRWRKWMYTTEWHYDFLKRTKSTYLRFAKDGYLRSVYTYNVDSTVSSFEINNFPNWNQRRNRDVKSVFYYGEDHLLKECVFFVNGKKRFVKKHHYEYY